MNTTRIGVWITAMLGVGLSTFLHAGGDQKGGVEPLTLTLDAAVRSLDWSRDGSLLATQSYRWEKDPAGLRTEGDGFSTIQLWDAKTGKLKHSLGEVKNSGAAAIALSPDGKFLAVSYRLSIAQGDKVELWDTETAGIKRTVDFGYGRNLPALAFSPDGKLFAVAHTDDAFRSGALVFETATGDRKHALLGHQSLGGAVAFAADGKTLATGGSDGTIRLWNSESGKESQVLEVGVAGRVYSLGFSPDGKRLVIATDDGQAIVWDIQKKAGTPLKDVSARTFRAAFSPNGEWIAVGGIAAKGGNESGEVRLYNAHTGEFVRSWDDAVPKAFSFSPDRQSVAIGHAGKQVKLWPLKR